MRQEGKSWIGKNIFSILLYVLSLSLSLALLLVVLVFRIYGVAYYYETFLLGWVIADLVMWLFADKLHSFIQASRVQRRIFRFIYFLIGIVAGGLVSAFLYNYFGNLQGRPFLLVFVTLGVVSLPLALLYFQIRYPETATDGQGIEEGDHNNKHL